MCANVDVQMCASVYTKESRKEICKLEWVSVKNLHVWLKMGTDTVTSTCERAELGLCVKICLRRQENPFHCLSRLDDGYFIRGIREGVGTPDVSPNQGGLKTSGGHLSGDLGNRRRPGMALVQTEARTEVPDERKLSHGSGQQIPSLGTILQLLVPSTGDSGSKSRKMLPAWGCVRAGQSGKERLGNRGGKPMVGRERTGIWPAGEGDPHPCVQFTLQVKNN